LINFSLSIEQKRKDLIRSAINILHNCAKASENRQILCELRALERIAPFLKADDMGVVVVATLTLSYIASDEQKKLLEAESRVCPFFPLTVEHEILQCNVKMV